MRSTGTTGITFSGNPETATDTPLRARTRGCALFLTLYTNILNIFFFIFSAQYNIQNKANPNHILGKPLRDMRLVVVSLTAPLPVLRG